MEGNMVTCSRQKMPSLVATLAAAMLLLYAGFSQAKTEFNLSSLAALEAKATVYFVSPESRGTADGSSESNALPFAKLHDLIYDVKTSTKVILLPGVYNLPEALALRAPSANDVLVLEGRDNAVIRGNFNFNTLTGTDSGLRLQSDNIIVRGLDFENVGYCIKANRSSAVNQVLIENIEARRVHSCILVDRGSLQDVSHWIVRNSRIDGYFRVGVRLAGSKTHDIVLDNVQIDGAHDQVKNDCFKSGIQLLDSVSNVDILNTTIANNIGACGDKFQQGDGIEADNTGGAPNNITIDKVRISNSGDAELDLKAENVTMNEVVALGGDLTHYVFKVWNYRNYQCTNCYAYGPHIAYINVVNASISFHTSTFTSGSPVRMCDLRHGTTPEQQSFVQFENVQMYVGNEELASECGAGVLADVKRLPLGRIAPPAPVTDVQTE